MGTKANLLGGIGTIYIGPAAEALPEIDDLAPPAITVTPAGNWTAVGYTENPYELSTVETFEDHEINESNGKVKKRLVKEEGTFKFFLSEHDLTAYSKAINASSLSTVAAGANQTAQDQFKVGDGTATEKSLLVVSSNPEGGSRLIHIFLAVQQGTVTFAQSHGKYPPIQVEFDLIMDTGKTAGERLYKIYDITAAASS